MTYDVKSEMLARHFLQDFAMDQAEFDKRVPVLAQRIQQAVEDYVSDEGLKP